MDEGMVVPAAVGVVGFLAAAKWALRDRKGTSSSSCCAGKAARRNDKAPMPRTFDHLDARWPTKKPTRLLKGVDNSSLGLYPACRTRAAVAEFCGIRRTLMRGATAFLPLLLLLLLLPLLVVLPDPVLLPHVTLLVTLPVLCSKRLAMCPFSSCGGCWSGEGTGVKG